MTRPIAISLSPNTQKDDVILALKKIINPLAYKKEKPAEVLGNKLTSIYGDEYKCLTLRSGREALFLTLKSLGIKKGDEILVQAFTCSAAVIPITWNGAKPVYVDIDESYNMNPDDIPDKINKNTKAIIVQHTFGIPAKVKRIKEIAKENNLLLIEDCAVSLGAEFEGRPVGSFGDVSYFSFGRDKVISSVWGGALITKDLQIFKKIQNDHQTLDYPSHFWIFQQLLHPVVFSLILPLYNLGIGRFTVGKVILFLLQKMHFLSFPVSSDEKRSEKPEDYPQRLPGAIAELALNQLDKLEQYNKHRKKIAAYYHQKLKDSDFKLPQWNEGSMWLRYPIEVEDARELIGYAKSKGMLLGDWYKQPIYPIEDLRLVNYHHQCERVEDLDNSVVNLPTYPGISQKDAQKVINLLIEWQSTR